MADALLSFADGIINKIKKMKTCECTACKLKYPSEELAKKCEAWCVEHHSCNLDIIKYAISNDGGVTHEKSPQ